MQNLAAAPEQLQELDSRDLSKGFQLGQWRVDVSGGELSDGERSLRLEPRLMQILVLLACEQGAVVSREQIFDAVWPNQEVSDQTLDSALSRLRTRLGDDSRSPTFIRTVPKKGYRLLIEPVSLEARPREGRPTPEVRSQPILIAFLAIGLMALLAWIVVQTDSNLPKAVLPEIDAPSNPYLAVLPFSDLEASEQIDSDYDLAFSSLLLEQLARVPGLQVVSQDSAFQFSSQLLTTPIDVQRAAQLLGADFLLGGYIERRGNALTAHIQLADARRGVVVWTRALSDGGGDTLSLHRQIIAELLPSLLPESTGLQAEVGLDRPRSGVTYELYLLGRHYWHQRRPDSLIEAERLFREALAREPDFALAQTGLANTYLTMIDYGGLARPDALALVQAPMAEAIRLAPELAETHLVVGRWHLARFEWAEAEAALKRALALNPNLSMAQMFLGNVYNDSGQIDLAYASYREALVLDPLHATVLMNLSQSALKLGLHDRAHGYLERARALFPQHTFLLGLSAHQLQAAGDQAAAKQLIDRWEQERAANPGAVEPVDWLACAMLQSFVERPARALACLDAIEQSPSDRGLLPLETLMVLTYRVRLLQLTDRPIHPSLLTALAEQVELLNSPGVDDPTLLYEVAVAKAVLNRADAAVDIFLRAQRRGARDVGWMAHDRRLDTIRERPDVRHALASQAADQQRRGDQVRARFPSAGRSD